MNYCSKCGAPVDANHTYCGRCGNPVNATAHYRFSSEDGRSYYGENSYAEAQAKEADYFDEMAEGLARGSLKTAKVMLKIISAILIALMCLAAFISVGIGCVLIYNFAVGNVLLIPKEMIFLNSMSVLSGVELLVFGCGAGFIGIGLLVMSYNLGKCVFTAESVRIGEGK
ncbi:MAG: zinc ribbon domain-containing protein [Lachnospiraceae bacterium]|nr:zinc ribbon domain-containing protein [Lachnospiraceae bacterium]